VIVNTNRRASVVVTCGGVCVGAVGAADLVTASIGSDALTPEYATIPPDIFAATACANPHDAGSSSTACDRNPSSNLD
jgi:hypothetical protein